MALFFSANDGWKINARNSLLYTRIETIIFLYSLILMRVLIFHLLYFFYSENLSRLNNPPVEEIRLSLSSTFTSGILTKYFNAFSLSEAVLLT